MNKAGRFLATTIVLTALGQLGMYLIGDHGDPPEQDAKQVVEKTLRDMQDQGVPIKVIDADTTRIELPPDIDERYSPTAEQVRRIATQITVGRMLLGDRIEPSPDVVFMRQMETGEGVRVDADNTDYHPSYRGLSYEERRRADYLGIVLAAAFVISSPERERDAQPDAVIRRLLCEFVADEPYRDAGYGSCYGKSPEPLPGLAARMIDEELPRVRAFANAVLASAKPAVEAFISAAPKTVPTTHDKQEYIGAWWWTEARLMTPEKAASFAEQAAVPWEACMSRYCGALPPLAGSPACAPATPFTADLVSRAQFKAECAKQPQGLCAAAVDAAAAVVVSRALFGSDDHSAAWHAAEIKVDGDAYMSLTRAYTEIPVVTDGPLPVPTLRRNFSAHHAAVAARSVVFDQKGAALDSETLRGAVGDLCQMIVRETVPRTKPEGTYDPAIDGAFSDCTYPVSGRDVVVPTELRPRYDRESELGFDCAEAIVAENRAHIESLALRMFRHPPNARRPLVMNGHEIDTWFCDHPVSMPSRPPKRTASYCSR